ncbi:MAG TPA: site-2 protease family protein [Thermoanaerobaculia bacterium]|nr:site-2 protease family protein [Thermoanaerobaculia bacterium]
MKSSFRLLRVAGIDIKIHFTFPLALLFGAFDWGEKHGSSGAVFGAFLMLALFACVVLHELGHSLVAQRFGIEVRQIILLPIGGVALLGRLPRKPVQELLIAIAGPLVNVAIALGLGLFLGFRGDLPLDGSQLLQLAQAAPSTQTFLQWLFYANISLFVFNLLPAFPMDGGRILRAILAMIMGFSRGTRVAAGVGQMIALALGLFAIFHGQILLALVAAFVFLGAGQERAVEEARILLSTLRLGDAYNKYALTLNPGDSVHQVIDYLLTSYQPDFAVVLGGRLLGVVTRDAVLQSLATGHDESYVTGVMNREVLRLDADLSLAQAREKMAEASAPVAAVFAGERFLGLINQDDISEALRIAAFLRLAHERKAEESAA